MKRTLKWILGLVLCLAVMIGCGMAAAEGNGSGTETGFVLKTEDGTVLSDGATLEGLFYYRIYVEGLPDGCKELSLGWNPDMSATAPYQNEWEDREPERDEDGRLYLFIMPEPEGDYDAEIMFARLGENGPVTHINLYYDRSPVRPAGQKPVITNTKFPGLGERDYKLEWTAVDGTEFYQIVWDAPADDGDQWYWNHENELDLEKVWGDPTWYPGNYRVRVFAFAGGRLLQASDDQSFTIAIPQPNMDLTPWNDVWITPGEDPITVELNQWVNLTATAVCADDVLLYTADTATEPFSEKNCFDRGGVDDEGLFRFSWTPSGKDIPEGFNIPESAGETNHFDKYVFCRARYGDTWAESNRLLIRAEMGAPITKDPTWLAPAEGEYTVDQGRYQVPRDGMFHLKVANSEAGIYGYGMSIFEDDDLDKEVIADSMWVPVETGDYTNVYFPMADLMPGDYQVYVYAVKFGALHRYNETTPINITVTAPVSSSPILFSMKDTFDTHERLRICAVYTNPDNAYNNGFMHIEVFNENNDRMMEDHSGFYFWNEWWTLERQGSYRITATAYARTYEGQQEPTEICSRTFDITVNAGTQVAVVEPEFPDYITEGQDFEFDVVKPTNCEAYNISVWMHDDETDADIAIFEAEGLTTANYHVLVDPYDFNDASAVPMTYVYISIYGYGGRGVSSDDRMWEIPLVPAPTTGSDRITLSTEGLGEDNTILSSRLFTVRADAPGATAVRVLNGDRWEYWKNDDLFKREWSFGEDVLLYAEATWEEIDYDELDRNNWKVQDDGVWRQWDWDQDVNWAARSNSIRVHVINPNGEIAKPNAVLENPASEGSIPVIAPGEELVINITDANIRDLDGNVIPSSWYFANMERQEMNDRGDSWWQRENNDFELKIHSGTNYIPTINLNENAAYRIEIGADAEGYRANHTYLEFRTGNRVIPEEPLKNFRVYGGTPDATAPRTINALAGEELELAAYHTGAEWVCAVITKDGSPDWREDKNECRNGILSDAWRIQEAGTYTMTAYGCGRLDGPGLNGEDHWEDPIGTFTVIATAPSGDLGDPVASLNDEINPIILLNDTTPASLTITFTGPANATFFDYWIHAAGDRKWLAGDQFEGNVLNGVSDSVDIERLPGPGVYVADVNVFAPGYNQGHGELYFAMLDKEAADCSDSNITITMISENIEPDNGMLFVPVNEEIEIIVYKPEADAIRLEYEYRRETNSDPEYGLIEEFDGPGKKLTFAPHKMGYYTICYRTRKNGTWTGTTETETILYAEANGTLVPTAISVNGTALGENSVQAPTDGNNEHRLNIVIPPVMDEDQLFTADHYHIEVKEYGDGWFIDDRDVVISEDETYSYQIEDDRIRSGSVYEIIFSATAPMYEGFEIHQIFLLQNPATNPGVTLTVSPTSGDEYWTAENAWVVAKALDGEGNLRQDVTAIKVCMNNEAFYYRGSSVGAGIMIWNTDSVFYACATTDPIPEGDFDWNEWDADWNIQSAPVAVHASTYGDTLVPSLSFYNNVNHVEKGEWLLFTIGNDGDARQMDIRIRDDMGHILEFRQLWAPGMYSIPTGNLNVGQRYWVNLSCIQDRHLWTEGPYMELYIDAPESNAASFSVSQNVLYPNEPFIPSVYAPGAEHVWIANSDWDMNTESRDGVWGDWNGEYGTNDTNREWWFDEPGTYSLSAWARYPGSSGLTLIDTVDFIVTPQEPLERAQFITSSVWDVTEAHVIEIPVVTGGYYYEVTMYRTNMENQPVYSRTMTAAEKDPSGNLQITVPTGTLTADQTYWIKCRIHPAQRDYQYEETSESRRSILTISGSVTGNTDDNLTVTANAGEYGLTQVPVNATVNVSVSVKENPTETPTAIAVHLGDDVKYGFYHGEPVRFGVSDYETGTEALYAQAYYGELNENTDNIPWDTLAWGDPCFGATITFISYGKANPATIACPGYVVAGDDLVINVTLGEHANEAHANLDRNTTGWEEDLVFGDWIGGLDPDDSTLTIPTADIAPGLYRLYVDNSGIGYENNRAEVRFIQFVGSNPFDYDNRLDLPAGLTEIGEEAFAGIAAETVIIPNGTTTIGSKAFANSSVRFAVIPASVTSIAPDAFEGCEMWVFFGYNEYAQNYAVMFNNSVPYGVTYHMMGE